MMEVMPQREDTSAAMSRWKHLAYYQYGDTLIARSQNCKVVIRMKPVSSEVYVGLLNGSRLFDRREYVCLSDARKAGLKALKFWEKEKPWDHIPIGVLPDHCYQFTMHKIFDCPPNAWQAQEINEGEVYLDPEVFWKDGGPKDKPDYLAL